MPVLTQLLAFLAVALVVICTPGPDTALTVRNVLAGGRVAGIATAAGVAIGQLIWTVAAGLGLATILRTSQLLFEVLRLAGAAYLIFLGSQALWSALRGGSHSEGAAALETQLGTRSALRQGLISNLANPKMVAFFLSLLPQFLPAEIPSLLGFLALGSLFCLLTFGWLSLCTVALHRAGRWLRRSRTRRILDASAGAVLVALGVKVVLQRT
jgi:threonine/homoserine/homoserine lactone efflux protein